jgi:dCTP deaminase
MILSGRDLQWYIRRGALKIEPSTPEQFQQNGFDSVIENAELCGDKFYLAGTREVFELPDDLMAFVGLRSTWARLGFSLPMTVVDAGFRGNLTLEIVNFGTQPVPLGQRFAHLVFARLTGPSEPYRGKYDKQLGVTRAKI